MQVRGPKRRLTTCSPHLCFDCKMDLAPLARHSTHPRMKRAAIHMLYPDWESVSYSEGYCNFQKENLCSTTNCERNCKCIKKDQFLNVSALFYFVLSVHVIFHSVSGLKLGSHENVWVQKFKLRYRPPQSRQTCSTVSLVRRASLLCIESYFSIWHSNIIEDFSIKK